MLSLSLIGNELSTILNESKYIIILTMENFKNNKYITLDNFTHIIHDQQCIINYELLINILVLTLTYTINIEQLNSKITESIVLNLMRIIYKPEDYNLVKFNYKLMIDSEDYENKEIDIIINGGKTTNLIQHSHAFSKNQELEYRNELKNTNKIKYKISINFLGLNIQVNYVNQYIKSIDFINSFQSMFIKTHKNAFFIQDIFLQKYNINVDKLTIINQVYSQYPSIKETMLNINSILDTSSDLIEDRNIYHFIEILKLINYGPYNRIYYDYKPNYKVLKFNIKSGYKSIFEYSYNLYQHIYTFNNDTFDTLDTNEYILVDLINI